MSKIHLKNVRLSFPDIFVAKPFSEGDEPKFKAAFLLGPKHPQLKEVNAAITKLAKDKWGAKADGILKSIRTNPNKFCWQDGNNKDYDGYADHWVLSASNKARPTVIDRDRSPLTAADGRPYAGCYVNAIVELFTYDNTGKGIAASLSGVQFLKDGEPFSGGRAAAAEDFDDLSDQGDDGEGATAGDDDDLDNLG